MSIPDWTRFQSEVDALVGTRLTPFEGARIKAWRPHWSVLHKARAEDISLFGSEEEKWKHNPIRIPSAG